MLNLKIAVFKFKKTKLHRKDKNRSKLIVVISKLTVN